MAEQPKKNSEQSVTEAIARLSNLVDANWRHFSYGSDELASPPSSNAIARYLLIAEISETVKFLQMVGEEIIALRTIDRNLHELLESVSASTVAVETEAGRRFHKMMTEKMRELGRLVVHMKATYEWLTHIKELLTAYGLRQLIPDSHWRKLSALCIIRHKLIAHKQNKKTYFFGGVRHMPNYEDIQPLLSASNLPKSIIQEVEKLFFDCSDKLDEKERTEQNYHERLSILASKLGEINDDRRKRIVFIIERYGVFLPKLSELVIFVDEFFGGLVPELAKLKP